VVFGRDYLNSDSQVRGHICAFRMGDHDLGSVTLTDIMCHNCLKLDFGNDEKL
jgi:hypothetical protein